MYFSFFFLLLPACSINTTEHNLTVSLLIQIHSALPVFNKVIERLEPEIEKIIKHELGLPNNYNFQFFYQKN